MSGVPERTCVSCRTRRPKPELIRVARGPDGWVRPDVAGTASGRGAYVCRDPDCVRGAIPKLARAFRTPDGGFDTLREELEELV